MILFYGYSSAHGLDPGRGLCQPRSPQGARCVELRLKPQLKASLVSAHREDEEEGDDSAAAQLTHRIVRGVAGATPQGALVVSSCG